MHACNKLVIILLAVLGIGVGFRWFEEQQAGMPRSVRNAAGGNRGNGLTQPVGLVGLAPPSDEGGEGGKSLVYRLNPTVAAYACL